MMDLKDDQDSEMIWFGFDSIYLNKTLFIALWQPYLLASLCHDLYSQLRQGGWDAEVLGELGATIGQHRDPGPPGAD